MPNIILKKPWSYITVDFITKLLLTQDYDSILVVYNRITKMAYFMPTTEKLKAIQLARKYYYRQKSAVHSRNNKRVECDIRN